MESKKPISHIAAGLIIAGVLIVLSICLHFADVQQTGALAWISYLIMIGGLIAFINLYGNAMNNQVSFGNLFSYGFKTTAVMTVIMILFTVIFFLIFPEIKEKLFETTRQKMEERQNMTTDDIEKAMSFWRRMFWVLTIGSSLLMYAIVGAIGSVIGAAITKKKRINPVDQLNF